MNYRDERDALRGRIEGLEQDLDEARRAQQDDAVKRARIEQIEARMRETEQNMQAMRSELAALGAGPKPKKNLVPLVIGMGVATAVAAMAGVFLMLAPRVQPRAAVEPYQHTDVGPAHTSVPIAEPPPIPAFPKEEPVKPLAPVRQVNAQWTGKITRAQGIAAAPGAPCVVDATLESQGDKQRVTQLSVKCAGKVVYNSTDKLEGMSMTGSGMAEEPGKESGTFSYAISYSDTGARAGSRSQISLDTTQKQGAVWSEVIPIFRVEFSVPPLSGPIKGEALIPKKEQFGRLFEGTIKFTDSISDENTT